MPKKILPYLAALLTTIPAAFAVQFAPIGATLNWFTDVGRGFSVTGLYNRGAGQFVDGMIYFMLIFMFIYPAFKKRYSKEQRIGTALPVIIAFVLAASLTGWAYMRSPPFQLMISIGPWFGLAFFIGIIALVYYVSTSLGASTAQAGAFVLLGIFMLLESPIAQPVLDFIARAGMIGEAFLALLGVLRFIAIIALIYWLIFKLVPRLFGRGSSGGGRGI